jgi:hypothetical protein
MKLVASLVLAFLTLAAPAIAQIAPEKLIVPGKGIGPYSLDMTVDDLVKATGGMQAVGPPDGQTTFFAPSSLNLRDGQDLWAHRFDHKGFRVTTKQKDDQRIVVMNAPQSSVGYTTKEGITLGSTRDAVEAAFGKPDHVTLPNESHAHLIYDKLGIGVRVRNTTGQVDNIIVFRPGEAKERWKL